MSCSFMARSDVVGVRVRRLLLGAGALLCGLGFVAAPAAAAGEPLPSFTVVIENHRFVPEEIAVPAGERFTLVVQNKDRMIEEFESHELNLEKFIPGGTEARFTLGPLEAGVYGFFGEFHPKTAQGRLIAGDVQAEAQSEASTSATD